MRGWLYFIKRHHKSFLQFETHTHTCALTHTHTNTGSHRYFFSSQGSRLSSPSQSRFTEESLGLPRASVPGPRGNGSSCTGGFRGPLVWMLCFYVQRHDLFSIQVFKLALFKTVYLFFSPKGSSHCTLYRHSS